MSETNLRCWFSGTEATVTQNPDADELIFHSSLLGQYNLSFELSMRLKQVLKDSSQEVGPPDQGRINCARHCLSVHQENQKLIPYWVLRDELDDYRVRLGKSTKFLVCCFEEFFESAVDHSLKPTQLLRAFGTRLSRDGAFARFRATLEDQISARIVDKDELAEIIRFLDKGNLLSVYWPEKIGGASVIGASQIVDGIFSIDFRMTVDGWGRLAPQSRSSNSNKVFIAMQFAWPADEERDRVEVLAAIKEACSACGYEASLVSNEHTGNITDRIISDIRSARFVVADLTYNNRGVYFESGFARALDVPVFHLIRDGHIEGLDSEGKKIHFDIRQIIYRSWTNPTELRQVLEEWVRARMGNFKADGAV